MSAGATNLILLSTVSLEAKAPFLNIDPLACVIVASADQEATAGEGCPSLAHSDDDLWDCELGDDVCAEIDVRVVGVSICY